MNNIQEAYEQLVTAINYLEANDEDPTPEGGDVFLTGKTHYVLWNRWEKRFEVRAI